MPPTICLAIAIALGVPADPRPSWRPDFAPNTPPRAEPRPEAGDRGLDAPSSPFGARTGQIVLRGCINRPEAVQRLSAQGYGLASADMTDDGKFYERWTRPDGRWESGVADPVTGLYCPLFGGPGWLPFVPADR